MYNDVTLKNTAYILFITTCIGWLVFIGSEIILPLIFALILAIFLYPIDRKIHSIIKLRWLSILLSFMCVFIPITLVGSIFAYQFIEILDSLPSINSSLKKGVEKIVGYFQYFIPTIQISPIKFIKDNLGADSINFVGQGFVSSTSILISTFLTFIYTFFLIYYKKSFRNFIVYQFEKRFRPDIAETLTKIKLTVQSYIGGLFIVIATLSVVNSLGLWIIGIKYPLFWGTLAGFLAIIPYIGTGIGGLLPFLYSLATYEHSWQPIAIVIFYALVQAFEGNILTPKIVGDKVNINPFFAILALMFFGSLWGISGIILALPLISILRIILSQFDATLPLAILMSSDVEEKAQKIKSVMS